MKRDQWKSRGELEELQGEKLRSLVSYAGRNVPFYRGRLGSVRGLDDLRLLPRTRKREIKGQEERLLSREYGMDSLQPANTSGSTGIPLRVYFSGHDRIYNETLRYQLYTEAGLGPLDVQAQLTFAKRRQGLINRLGLLRCHNIPFSESDRAALEALRKVAPRALMSNPVWLSALAAENRSSGFGLRVRNIFSTGEMLSQGARGLIAGSFGADLRNRYGSVETGSVAWECERGSLHLYSDSVVIEILDGQGEPVREGTVGNVVVTPLWRRAMPFIRYELGDMAAMGTKCRCGRGLHVIKSLEGRSDGFLILPSGRPFIAAYVGGKLRSFHDIMQFQVVQERSLDLRIRIVPLDKGRSPERARIIEAVRALLPEPLGVEVEFVDRIEKAESGKICDFVTRARQPLFSE